jgi:hypothetical protein
MLINKISGLHIPKIEDEKACEVYSKKYEKKVKRLEFVNKIQNRMFFIMNIRRYGISVAFNSLKSFILKRIKGG